MGSPQISDVLESLDQESLEACSLGGLSSRILLGFQVDFFDYKICGNPDKQDNERE